MQDIFITCVDGLKGFPEAIEAVYPRTEVQLCIVHLVRASLNYVPWKLRKQAVADLQVIIAPRPRLRRNSIWRNWRANGEAILA